MATNNPPYVMIQKIGTPGTSEALTAENFKMSSVFFKPEGVAAFSAATGAVYIIDGLIAAGGVIADANRFPVPTDGITLPVEDPTKITIDAAVANEGVRAIGF